MSILRCCWSSSAEVGDRFRHPSLRAGTGPIPISDCCWKSFRRVGTVSAVGALSTVVMRVPAMWPGRLSGRRGPASGLMLQSSALELGTNKKG